MIWQMETDLKKLKVKFYQLIEVPFEPSKANS